MVAIWRRDWKEARIGEQLEGIESLAKKRG